LREVSQNVTVRKRGPSLLLLREVSHFVTVRKVPPLPSLLTIATRFLYIYNQHGILHRLIEKEERLGDILIFTLLPLLLRDMSHFATARKAPPLSSLSIVATWFLYIYNHRGILNHLIEKEARLGDILFFTLLLRESREFKATRKTQSLL
jgi:hypothetical protein